MTRSNRIAVCLDTNTLVHYFQGRGGVAERLHTTPPGRVGIPVPVVYEILVGLRKRAVGERRRAQFDAFLTITNVLLFGHAEADHAADIRVSLEASGTPIGPIDILIAATARAHGATLVTRNLREFRRVPDLRVESWYTE